MKELKHIFENNKKWAESIKQEDPTFFDKLAEQQAPEILWIGCSDSRVPATEIANMMPGEIFVHRNIANVVVHTDLNCLSVIQYAVDVLKVKHIVVCGHYGCGGVLASMTNKSHGLIDNWLRHIRDIYQHNKAEVDAIEDESERKNRMCELNVFQQVANLCHTTIVQDAWNAGQKLTVHGWIYDIKDGILKDLNLCINTIDQLPSSYKLY